MSLSMFKNKLYNTIIAVSLIVVIMVVSTYAPDILPGESKSDKGGFSKEI